MKSQMSRIGRYWFLVACLLVMCLLSAGASTLQTAVAAGSNYSYVPNEYLVQAVAGSSLDAVKKSVAAVGGTVTRVMPLPDTYLVKMGTVTTGIRGAVSRYSTTGATAVSSPWVIKTFSPNYIYSATALPGDEFWSNQWDMVQIHMPSAWDVQKGSASVVVAVIDSGVAKHPELVDRLMAGYDWVDGDANPYNDGDGHGTHVAGTIAAQGDNQFGISGVCWDGVQIMPLRVLNDAGNGNLADIIPALQWAIDQNVDVVNMSLGNNNPYVSSELLHTQIQIAARAGIILCAAAGNMETAVDIPDVREPAKYDECIAVGAVGPQDQIAAYSCYGPAKQVDIAAPGGDYARFGVAGEVYSTFVTGGDSPNPTYGYEALQGTSMACPHVAGAAALLLSNGTPWNKVRERLIKTARMPATTAYYNVKKYGAGILDVSAALSGGSLSIAKPVKGSVVNQNPEFKISLDNIDPNSIAVYVDYTGDGVPSGTDVPVLAGAGIGTHLNTTQDTVSFNWSDISSTPLAPGKHAWYVSGRTNGTKGENKSDWGTFGVASRSIPAGQHLVAFPYQFANTSPDGTVSISTLPSDLLTDSTTGEPVDFRLSATSGARLTRWNAAQSYYASYVTGLVPPYDNTPKFDDKAWLNPLVNMLMPDTTVRAVPTAGGYLTNNNTSLQFPAGTGYWLTLKNDAVLSNAYTEVSAPQGFKIPLYKGWNLIGNPFGHDVPLASIHLSYQGLNQRTLDEDQASGRPWVDANFYGYKSGSGYELVPSDKRLFEPYKGYWVKANFGGISPYESLYMVLQ